MSSTGPTDQLGYANALARMPKVDLHCHLFGTVDAALFGRLVRKAGLALPAAPQEIYSHINSTFNEEEARRRYAGARHNPFDGAPDLGPGPWYSLHQVFAWIGQAAAAPDDYREIAYEAVRAAAASHTVHAEYSVGATPRRLGKLTYEQMIDAVTEGLEAGEKDFGVTSLIVIDLDRSTSARDVLDTVEAVVSAPRRKVAGVGLAAVETLGPPERFTDAFALARRHGLRATAHASEHVPSAANITTCLDVLGCDRIDHGYFVLEDDSVIERCRRDQIPFTCMFDTSRLAWRPWRRRSVTEMLRQGLKVVLCSDDPGMFGTTQADEFRIGGLELGYSWETMCQVARNGVDACWLPVGEKQTLHTRVETELAALRGATSRQ